MGRDVGRKSSAKWAPPNFEKFTEFAGLAEKGNDFGGENKIVPELQTSSREYLLI
jgi:hypothetical protein